MNFRRFGVKESGGLMLWRAVILHIRSVQCNVAMLALPGRRDVSFQTLGPVRANSHPGAASGNELLLCVRRYRLDMSSATLRAVDSSGFG